MVNPIKIVKTLSNVGSKAMRGKATSKGIKKPDAKGVSQVTSGFLRANKQAGPAQNVPATGNKRGVVGSNRTLKKAIKKSENK